TLRRGLGAGGGGIPLRLRLHRGPLLDHGLPHLPGHPGLRPVHLAASATTRVGLSVRRVLASVEPRTALVVRVLMFSAAVAPRLRIVRVIASPWIHDPATYTDPGQSAGRDCRADGRRVRLGTFPHKSGVEVTGCRGGRAGWRATRTTAPGAARTRSRSAPWRGCRSRGGRGRRPRGRAGRGSRCTRPPAAGGWRPG